MIQHRTEKPTRIFDGEAMTCVMCGLVQHGSPVTEMGWRAIELQYQAGSQVHYVCPAHFPPAGSSKLAYKLAYDAVFRKLGLTK